jgi:hypothetical protein
VQLAFATGVASTRAAAVALTEKYDDPSAAARAFALAGTQTAMRRRHLGISAEEAQLYERLASRTLWTDTALRAPAAVLAANTLGQSSLWPRGISGDLPLLVVRAVRNEDEALVGQVLRAQEYWRLKGLKADVVIVTDFGHGLLAESSVRVFGAAASFMAVNTQSNSANMGFNLITKYPKADFVCIDAPEARLAVSDRISSVGDIAHRIVGQIDCPRIIITHGKHGCLTHERGQTVHSIPAVARRVIDTVGAGDAFLAVTAPLVAAGGALDRIGFIGNVVGALKVEIVGHRSSIDKPSLIKGITSLLR